MTEAVGPRLLDVAGTKAYLGGVSDRTVRGLVASGELVPVRLPSTRRYGESSRRLLFDRADLDRLIDKWKAASTTVPNAGLSAAALKGWRQSPMRKKGAA